MTRLELSKYIHYDCLKVNPLFLITIPKINMTHPIPSYYLWATTVQYSKVCNDPPPPTTEKITGKKSIFQRCQIVALKKRLFKCVHRIEGSKQANRENLKTLVSISLNILLVKKCSLKHRRNKSTSVSVGFKIFHWYVWFLCKLFLNSYQTFHFIALPLLKIVAKFILTAALYRNLCYEFNDR